MKLTLRIFVTLLVVPQFCWADPGREPYRIGIVYGFTGGAQAWSDYGRMGLELARDEINQGGGINGRPIELIFEDSKSIPAQSVAVFNKLTQIDHVSIVIGNVWSFITNPLIPLSLRQQVVLVSPTVMDASVETQSDYFFTMGYRIESIRAAVDHFFALHPGVKNAAIICWEDAWGRAYLNLWKEVAASRNVTIVDEACQADFSNDYRSDVTRIASKKPDLVIVSMYSDRVAARMREQHVKATLLTTSDLVEALAVRNADPRLMDGVYFTDWKPSLTFEKAFEAKFGKKPVLEAHNHYETLRSIVAGLRTDSEDPLNGIRSVKYDGVMGPVDFTQGPFVNHGIGELFVVKDGMTQRVGNSALRVGVIQSLTGIAAEDGNTAVRALQMAKDDIEAEGKMRIELIIEDDATDPKQSVTAYKKLAEQNVQAVIGPTWSFTTNAVIPFATRDGRVLVNTTTLPECLNAADDRDILYTTGGSVREQAKMLERFVDQRKPTSAAIVYTNNTWGEAQRAAFSAVLQAKKVEIVDQVSSAGNDAGDWSIVVPKLKTKKAVLWLLLLNKSDLAAIVRRARELGVEAEMFASYHLADTLRTVGSKEDFEGVCFPYPAVQLTSETEFREKYHARYGADPLVFSDSSYDALFLLARAFEESVSKNKPLNDALRQIRYDGVAGSYRFSESTSFSIGHASLMCIEHGAPVVK